jgi:WhiB family redox-sensing transcriptional regulator
MTNLHDLSALIEHSPDFDWVTKAACGSLSLDRLDHFFVDAGRTLSRDAASMCAGCPVRRECLGHAYDNEISAGYFGGVSPSKRRVMTREQALASIGDSGD